MRTTAGIVVALLLVAPACQASERVPLPPDASHRGLQVTYIGNEGYLVEAASRKILVDALYGEGISGYETLSDSLRSSLQAAREPYHDVDLVLATHQHADHFDPVAVGRHLSNNPRARFVSTEQSVEQMRESFEGFPALAGRITALFPAEGDKVVVPLEGLGLMVINLHHGRTRPFQNLGFLVELGGIKFLHVGDTEATPEEFRLYELTAESIDVAFVPYWHLLDEATRVGVSRAIGAGTIVAMHVPAADAPESYFGSAGNRKALVDALEELPGVTVFERPLETRSIAVD